MRSLIMLSIMTVVATGCATAAPLTSAPLKPAPDEEAIWEALARYVGVHATGAVEEGLGESCEYWQHEAASPPIRRDVSTDYHTLCALFRVDPDAESPQLAALVRVLKMEIRYPSGYSTPVRRRGALIEGYPSSRLEDASLSVKRAVRETFPPFRVVSDFDPQVSRPEARVTFVMVAGLAEFDEGVGYIPAQSAQFRQKRAAHLVKEGGHWTIVAVEIGGW